MPSRTWIGVFILIGLTGCQWQQDVRIVAIDAQSGERINDLQLRREIILEQTLFSSRGRIDEPPSERGGQPALIHFTDKTTVLVQKNGYAAAEIEYAGGTFWITTTSGTPVSQENSLLQLMDMDEIPKPKSTNITFVKDGAIVVRLQRLPKGYMTQSEKIAELIARISIMKNPERENEIREILGPYNKGQPTTLPEKQSEQQRIDD